MANKIYYNPETAHTFSSSGNTTFTPQNISNAAGRISAQWDRGSGVQPSLFVWRAKSKAAAVLVAGTRLEIYLSTSDGTIQDGNLGTSDAGVSTVAKLNNLRPVGAIVADSTTNGEPQYASGYVEIRDRYVSVVWWNALGQSLTNTAGDHEFILTPVPDEVQ